MTGEQLRVTSGKKNEDYCRLIREKEEKEEMERG